eukprot:5076360-Heterocapsa_arctica.AAC.1
MYKKLQEERQERKDKNDEHRRFEHAKVGLLVPHTFLTDVKYDYWSIRYYSMRVLRTRRPDFCDALVADAKRRVEEDERRKADDVPYEGEGKGKGKGKDKGKSAKGADKGGAKGADQGADKGSGKGKGKTPPSQKGRGANWNWNNQAGNQAWDEQPSASAAPYPYPTELDPQAQPWHPN